MKKGQFITIMITLITWIALTCLWAGSIQQRVTSNEVSNNRLGNQIERLTEQISETNNILHEIKGQQNK